MALAKSGPVWRFSSASTSLTIREFTPHDGVTLPADTEQLDRFAFSFKIADHRAHTAHDAAVEAAAEAAVRGHDDQEMHFIVASSCQKLRPPSPLAPPASEPSIRSMRSA